MKFSSIAMNAMLASLKNQNAYVAGGTGIVGSGVIKNLLESGVKCWTTARSDAKFDELKALIPKEHHVNLNFIKADLLDEQECIRVRETILKADGKLNNVITSIGGWTTNGLLSGVAQESFEKTLRALTLPHFLVYKTFAKHLSETPNSTYTFIGAGSAELKFFDPRASLLPIGASAVHGMFTSACSEFKTNKNLCIMQLRLFMWIRKEADAKYAAKKSEIEVGHDYAGKFVPYMIVKRKSDIFRVQTRTLGNQLYEQIIK